MTIVLLQSLGIASGGILSIGSILIVLLLLSSSQGSKNALAYAAGYFGGYMLIGALFLLVGQFIPKESRALSSVGSSVFVVLALLFFWMAFRRWRNPPTEPPKLFAKLDTLYPRKSLGFGALVSLLNFKNLAIYLSAVSVVALAGLTPFQALASVFLIDLVFCSSVLFPFAVYFFFPSSADAFLKKMRESLERHSHPISLVALCLFGALFLTNGIRGLWVLWL